GRHHRHKDHLHSVGNRAVIRSNSGEEQANQNHQSSFPTKQTPNLITTGEHYYVTHKKIGHTLKQLSDRLGAVVHQRERTPTRTGQFGGQFQAEALVNRGHYFSGRHRTFHRVGANFIAFAHDSPAFHAATSEINRPALRPVIPSTGGIDFRRAAELGEVAH